MGKLTKVELEQRLQAALQSNHATSVLNAQLIADKARMRTEIDELSNQLTTERRRRLNEGNGYRRIIGTMKHGRVPPSMDDAIDDADLTPGQRAIREHRRQNQSTL